MNGVVRLYDRFNEWTEGLSRVRYAILLGIEVFVFWIGLGLLFGDVSLLLAVAGALGSASAYYWLDPR